MRKTSLAYLLASAALAVAAIMSSMAAAQAPAPTPAPAPEIAPSLVPAHSVNLMTADGAAALGAQWRTVEAKIVEGPALTGHMPGYDKSYDIAPHAGDANFDDSSWQKIDAKGLGDRRGGGKVSFLWYRTTLTIPAKIGDFDPTGARAVLTAYVDDYAEVWVNGQMPRRAGVPSPAAISGFNMPNRVVIGDAVKPGDKIQVAIFGINGPISVAPQNFVFFRQASVEFYK
jgi:gluconolactonase